MTIPGYVVWMLAGGVVTSIVLLIVQFTAYYSSSNK